MDGQILNALLKRVSPPAYRHLEKHKIEPILYMTEWFMCAFSRTLPWASVLRVWDMFLCDGQIPLHILPHRQVCHHLSDFIFICPFNRSEDNIPCWAGVAEMHAGNS